MNVLLTGGAGYIGSHTAVELISIGAGIIIADNFSNSSPVVIDRIEKITGKRPKLYNVDVANSAEFERVFLENKIDSVIHFAGYKAVGESVKVPLSYYRNNIDCAVTTLELMCKYSVNSFILSSSATVYGIKNQIPYNEKMEVGPCANPYGWTKLFIEQITRDFCTSKPEFSAVLLRYFNPVGAHESGLIGEDPKEIPNNLMPYISKVAVGTLPVLKVFGNDYPTKDGTGVRDYIHVTDLAKGHVLAMKYAHEHTGVSVFNLGTGKGHSVLEMLEEFSNICGCSVPYEIVSRREGDLPEYYADVSRAEEKLGWKAEHSVADMCRDTWNWQVHNPKGYEE